MVDFWEVVGRMVSNDTFRNSIQDRFTAGAYQLDTAQRAIIPPAIPPAGQNDPTDHYQKLREIIGQTIKTRPMSLMGLGETLYTISFQSNRDNLKRLSARIKKFKLKTSDPGPQYHAALGAMILDSKFRDEYTGAAQKNCANYFGELSDTESADIATLANDQVFYNLCTQFCEECWECCCYGRSVFWNQPQEHHHPVAGPAKSLKPPLFKKSASRA